MSWLDSVAALGKTAGDAYTADRNADREMSAAERTRATAERDRQRNLADTSQRTWLFLGIGGSIAIIIIVIYFVVKKKG